MRSSQALAMLDRQLDNHADDPEARLQRIVGTTNQVTFEATVRAFVRQYAPEELNDKIIQGDSKVTISPTDIIRAQWPGAQFSSSDLDVRVPRKNDKIIIKGKTRNIEAPEPIYIHGDLVRINLQVRG